MGHARRPLRGVLQIAAIAAVAFTARGSLADHYRVPSGSMEPTVRVGDHIVVAKAAYGIRVPMTETWLLRFSEPRRGDVVVLDPPAEGDAGSEPKTTPRWLARDADGGEVIGEVLLKRVVAVGGDLVEVRDGRVRIGGRLVTEPWASVDLGGGPDFGPERVPPGKLLVLGDNRGNSRDGRAFGSVDEDRVLGRAVAVVAREGHLALHGL